MIPKNFLMYPQLVIDFAWNAVSDEWFERFIWPENSSCWQEISNLKSFLRERKVSQKRSGTQQCNKTLIKLMENNELATTGWIYTVRLQHVHL